MKQKTFLVFCRSRLSRRCRSSSFVSNQFSKESKFRIRENKKGKTFILFKYSKVKLLQLSYFLVTMGKMVFHML